MQRNVRLSRPHCHTRSHAPTHLATPDQAHHRRASRHLLRLHTPCSPTPSVGMLCGVYRHRSRSLWYLKIPWQHAEAPFVVVAPPLLPSRGEMTPAQVSIDGNDGPGSLGERTSETWGPHGDGVAGRSPRMQRGEVQVRGEQCARTGSSGAIGKGEGRTVGPRRAGSPSLSSAGRTQRW